MNPNQPPAELPKLYSEPQLAKYLGVSVDTVRRERYRGATDNIPAGALMGGGIVPLGKAVGAGLKAGKNALVGVGDAKKSAERILVQNMQRDRLTPEGVADRMREAKSLGVDDYIAADAMGRNTQSIAKIVARTPSEASEGFFELTANRQQGQGDRIKKAFTEMVGSGDDAQGNIARITDRMKTNAKADYDAAYSMDAPTDPRVVELFDSPAIQGVLGEAKRIAGLREVPITNLFTQVKTGKQIVKEVPSSVMGADGQPVMTRVVEDEAREIPTYRGWDFIKQELDAAIESGFKGDGSKTEAVALKEYRGRLKDLLTELNPHHEAALRKWSDDSAALEAIEAGAQLGVEKDMSRTQRKVVGGSDTYGNFAADVDAGGIAAALASNRKAAAVGRLVDPFVRKATGINEDVANELGDILMNSNPEAMNSLARAFANRGNMTARSPLTRMFMGPGFHEKLSKTSPFIAGVNAPRQGNGRD